MLYCSVSREVGFAGGFEVVSRAYSDGCAFFAVPSASSRSIPMTPDRAYRSTIPTAPVTAMTMTLMWGLTAMVALAVSTVTAGTPPVSEAPLMASYAAGAKDAFRIGATPAPSCEANPSCPHLLPLSPSLLPGVS